MEFSEFFKEVYYKPENQFKGINRLWSEIKDEAKAKGLTKTQLISFLKNQEDYQRTMNRRKKPQYPKITAPPGSYQADLTFYNDVSKRNRGFTSILNIIEITTRKAYAFPLKTKSGKEVLRAFEKFRKQAKNVCMIEVDAGTEFTNKDFEAWCEKHDIQYVTYNNDKRSMGMIERFHRTLREILASLDSKDNWYEHLNQAINIYNNTVHTATGYKPNDVSLDIANKLREEKLKHNIQITDKQNQMFQVGDKVRYFINKTQFQKGSGKFSAEVYPIERIEGLSIYLQGIDKPFRYYQLVSANTSEKNPKGSDEPDAELAKEKNAYKTALKLKDIRDTYDKVKDQQKKVQKVLNDPKTAMSIAERKQRRKGVPKRKIFGTL